MKRRFTFLTAAIALLTILAFPMGVWGQSDYSSDYTGNVTLSTEGGENASECEIIISNTEYNGIKAGTSKNNGAVMITVPSGTKYLHIHAAAWNNTTCSLAVTPTGYSNPIALTANSGISNNSPFTFNGDANTSDYYKVITFSSALTSATNLTFTATGGKRFVIWGVTSEGEGDTPTCATPTFSPAAGTYTEAQNVTISCTTENATVYYTTDGSEPSTESSVYNSALIISETTTLKAMATATGYNNSPVASATYTITTPLTIAAVRAQGTGNVFTKGVVTSCVGTTGYIQDNTAAICVYGSSLTVGDEITVAGTLSTYKGLLEITSPQVVVLSSGNTITPTVKTIAEINDDDYTSSSSIQGLYITIEEATVTLIEGSNTTIAQGTNTIVVRGINGVEYSVNDVLTLNGNIGCFDGAQIANPTNVEVQQTAEPSITVTPTEVNISAEGATGALTVTCENIDDSYEIGVRFYEDPQTPATNPAIYENWFEIVPAGGSSNDFHYEAYSNEGDARTAYLTICAFAANGEMLTESQLVTFTQAAYVAPTFAELPFSFNGGMAAIEETDGLSQEGLGTDYSSAPYLKFDGTGDWLLLQFDERPGILTFDIKGNSFSGGTFKVQTSADGASYSDLETYTTFGNNETFEEVFDNLGENVRYIKWIYTEKVSGNVGLGNIALAKYVLVPSITVTPTEVNISAEGATGALTVTCENIDDSYEIGVRFYSDPQTPATDPAIYEDWFEIVPAGGSSNDFHYEAYSNEGDARTAYLTICAFAANGEMLTESQLVTVNQSAPVVPATGDEYALYTGELVEGDYLIVYNGGAMNNTVSSNRLQYESVTVTNDAITTDNAAIVWHIAPSGDYWTLYNVDANAYAASTGTKNQAQMLANGTDDKALWTVSGTETYEFVNKKNTVNNVNANLRKNGTYGFACYATSTGGALSLYKKVVEPETHTLYINGYTSDETKDGYYLIASPVSVDPASVEGMTTGDFDLYYFDESKELEWINYEDQTNGGFNLVPGKGYLYAKKATAETPTYTFELTGTPYSGNGVFPLSYTEDAVFAGWNLVGNPYAVSATPNKPYYRLNDAGSEVSASTESSAVNAMEGVFVVATEAGQTVSFSTTPSGKGESIALNVMKDRGTVIDRAIVRFDEGGQLPKFQLFENSTKLYIPQGNSDYAIVRSAAEGEMPVNFKARENGTYTISVNTENIEMDYLHLIDNMTGTDVDLLQTPSYTFEATTRDYASRFRLVFSADENGASAGSATFAYFNGNEWVVSNEGEAQLHVIDMTGRIVSTETINGNATVKVNAAPGVYMLRLVNGNEIKTQKVIIK